MDRFSLFPDSPSLRQVFSKRSLVYRWRNGDPIITAIIMVLCIAIWIVEAVLRYISTPAFVAMISFGMFQPVTALMHPWTFITSMFLHQPNSLWHILFNMLTLWCVGPFVERLMGHWSYLILYLLSGVAGNVGMIVAASCGSLMGSGEQWYNSAYGASGAIFGLFAAMLVVYRRVGEDIRSMLVWMGVNFLMPIVVPNIAWQAHLAGFLIGGLLTLLVMVGLRALRFKPVVARTAIYGGAILVILALIVFACNMYNPLTMLIGFSY
ncbi:rhomboid family intramembrane serine protease [Bifidobacterium magnum]|uniref:Intramembrane Rhomboid protease n=1 Tax=Bifidobacterium magnum TaxID=1692 RepID=A0A087BAM1_9BIFI|nr:rhomboid family intramembrane serine protease [Bifidobacterium magnum]KFI68071.1 Intramembrane Rhomboid protease [Bifidobacterium magnum]